jgi:hypothetical protein
MHGDKEDDEIGKRKKGQKRKNQKKEKKKGAKQRCKFFLLLYEPAVGASSRRQLFAIPISVLWAGDCRKVNN